MRIELLVDSATSSDLVKVGLSEQIEMESQLVGDQLKLCLRSVGSAVPTPPHLRTLQVDGASVIDQSMHSDSPELAANPSPGVVSGTGAIVSGLTEPLEVGATYMLSYEILDNTSLDSFFVPASNGAPFSGVTPPREVGTHHLILVAQDADTKALLRLSGTATFGFLSCRKAEWMIDLASITPGQAITANVGFNDSSTALLLQVPQVREFYVAPDGDDATGTGERASPFRQPAAAAAVMQAGDTAYLRPGVYAPFEVQSSGSASRPVTFTTLPGEERLAIIEGDLHTHAEYGGPGAVQRAQAKRGGVEIIGRDHVHIRNLTIQNMPFDGVHIEGDESDANLALTTPERHGNHIVAGCRIRNVGNAAIWGGGYFTDKVLRPGLILTDGLLFEHNDISETNVATDYNQTNAQGEPGGVNEAISVAGGVANAITRFNDIHDSRQYGVDYKHGVYGGAIHDNRVWNMVRYGIYLDTNRRTVENIDIYNNEIWACNLGIVFAREADFDPVADSDGLDMAQALRNIRCYANEVRDCNFSGIFCQRHPGDSPHGEITNVRIYDNVIRDCARLGSGNETRLAGWSADDFIAAGTVSGFEFTGNTLSRAHDLSQTNLLFDAFSGKPGFTVSGNTLD